MTRRKPDPLKVIEGTFRNDRANPEAPTPADELPVAPAHLTNLETDQFNMIVDRLEPMGVASSTDVEAIALVAKRLAEVIICSENITQEGMVIDTVNIRGERMLRGNPAVAQRSEAMRHLQSLLSEFGLTPAARTKVVAKQTKAGTGRFKKRSVRTC